MDNVSFSLCRSAKFWQTAVTGAMMFGFVVNATAGVIATTPLSAYPVGPHYILVVLDTSNKMDQAVTSGTNGGSNNATSKSAVARQAIIDDLISAYTGQPMINLGLMTYGGSDSTHSPPSLQSGFLQSDGTVSATPVTSFAAWYYNAPYSGMGYLQVPVKSLDSTQASTLKQKLACNVPGNAASCSSNGAPNAGTTPLPGVLTSANTYLKSPPLSSNEGGGNASGSVPAYCGDGITTSYKTVIVLNGSLPDTSTNGTLYSADLTYAKNTGNDPKTYDPAVAAASVLGGDTTHTYPFFVGFTSAAGTARTSQTVSAVGTIDELAMKGLHSADAAAAYTTDKASLDAALNNIMSLVTYGVPFVPSGASSSSSSATASNAPGWQASTLIYQAVFSPGNWYGDLNAYEIDPSTGKLKNSGLPVWRASDTMGNNTRYIYSYDPSKSTSKGIDFTWSNLNTTGGTGQQWLLGYNFDSAKWSGLSTTDKNTLGTNLVTYLKGDMTFDTKSDATRYFLPGNKSLQKVRARSGMIGDFANSDPLFVGSDDYAYDLLPEGAPQASVQSYASFLQATAVRKRVVYVGGNDGMLHAFNAGSYIAKTASNPAHFDNGDGTELFAYVPNSVIGPAMANLAKAPRPYFSHYYLVDGSPSVGDAYLPGTYPSSPWRTVLLGTTGAGARGVFALDVTDPDPTDASNPNHFSASKVLWEISDGDSLSATVAMGSGETSDAPKIHGDLGYTLSKPSLVRLNDGHWGALVANGYNSGNGHAVLFIFNVDTGKLLAKIDAGTVNSATNGLSTPTAIDIDDNRTADYVYAGDLTGNLWKFDISSTDNTKWGIANGGKPLFVACASTTTPCAFGNRQPITTKPALGALGSGQNGIAMLYFGTGKYFELYDNYVPVSPSPQVQTFYGLLDNGSIIADDSSSNAGRKGLIQQTIDPSNPNGVASGGNTLRTTSENSVNYASGIRGWYMDLPALGERVIATATVLPQTGRVVFETLIPASSSSTVLGSCQIGGDSWIMELSALDGKHLAGAPWDLNKDGVFDKGDYVNGQVPAGLKSSIGIVKSPAIISDGTTETKVFIGSGNPLTNSTIATVPESTNLPTVSGRVSWGQPQ